MEKKIEKKFLLSEIIASEMAAVNCLYYEGYTCQASQCVKETALRLFISVRESFSNAIPFTMINHC